MASATMKFTAHWMATNEHQAWIPDWPADILIGCMSRIKGRGRTYEQLLNLIDGGGLRFKIASPDQWEKHSAKLKADYPKEFETKVKVPMVRKQRSDIGHPRTAIHKNLRKFPQPEDPKSLAITTEAMDAAVDEEVKRMISEAEVTAKETAEGSRGIKGKSQRAKRVFPISHYRPY